VRYKGLGLQRQGLNKNGLIQGLQLFEQTKRAGVLGKRAYAGFWEKDKDRGV